MPEPEAPTGERGALAAVGRVLGAVTGAGFELQPILDRIAAEAAPLCHADVAFMFLREGDLFHFVAASGGRPGHWDYERSHPDAINRESIVGRVALAGEPVQIEDVPADPEYRAGAYTEGGHRTLLGVPIRTDDELIGAFGLGRLEVQPFSDAEIELVSVFADQAAIAIRIGGLLAEGRQAQDREQSVGAVLATIARGTFDVTEVLQAVIEEAVRLCSAETGNIAVRDGDVFKIRAVTGFSAEYAKAIEQSPYSAERGSVIGRTLYERGIVQIEDVLEDPEYALRDLQKVGRYRSAIGVPIWHEGEIIGVIATGRREVRPFADREVRLVESFADHVAIALNLARLLTETKEALERETAVGQVLQSISRSTFELDSVLQAVLDNAVRLSHADQGNITREMGGEFRARVFSADVPKAFRDLMTGFVPTPGRGSAMGRAMLERAPVQIVDVLADPEYELAEAQRIAGFRTILGVPMFRDGEPIGVLSVWRRHVREFSASEISLLKTFADQAVLAIENVRLFETIDRQRTELARYAPQAAELLSSSEGEQLLAGHRREITALFADLRGFTAFAERAEPEEVFSVLRQYHTAVGELAVANGGTVEHFAGDGLMVFFNDPGIVPDHQLAAVRTACEMRERFGDLSTAWHKRGYELGLGIGIAAGFATLGRIGFEGRYDYAAIGNSVILASRLSGAAGANQILVSQRVFAAVEDAVVAEAVPNLDLKGFSNAMTAYAVASVRDAVAS
jgi:GAF domain-containing protein